MPRDAQGNDVTADAAAVQAFDHAMDGFLRYRADLPRRLEAVLAGDPEFCLGHVLRGCLALTAFHAGRLPAARAALASAERLAPGATARERAHVAALAALVAGENDRALDLWDEVLAAHPRDLLAFRLHHFHAFWRGRPDRMLAGAGRVAPGWSAAVPGWGGVLACRAFAHEECGDHAAAEAHGRAALALDPGNLWAAHAVAHVMEMQGRREEGIGFLDGLETHWEGGNNLLHHLWWHRAMFHLERREFDRVLDLYDRRFRDLAAPLTAAAPDFYMDLQNAISILFRLGLRGVPAGARWAELADHAEARIGDCLSPFTLVHGALALAAAGREAAGERLLDAMRAAAASPAGGTAGLVLRESGIAVAEAALRHGRGDFAGAVAAMRPVLGAMHGMGGSHAQQDVLEQLFLDAAMRAGDADAVRLLLARVAGRHPVPPAQRIAYAAAERMVH
ncbi:hypothetical protein M0638_07340 [Roseomonas sp. NAR14]|uniref:Tetratricopeptide repeat protein 38 n=1 Tax=Roseomonas acroporae TaxID=2937791 RepID=A0A9X1Y4S1_9PROT|nr:hypothetical protein [Roseomonas acroporae]MCK8784189.1 hypothetical protein [Roseomonas acroporae]